MVSSFALSRTPETPIELAIDFILHDFEMAGQFFGYFLCLDSKKVLRKKNKYLFIYYLFCFLGVEVEPISTYVDFGDREFLVADERGYEHLLYKMAEDFLCTSGGNISL